MLFRAITAAYCDNRTKHKYPVYSTCRLTQQFKDLNLTKFLLLAHVQYYIDYRSLRFNMCSIVKLNPTFLRNTLPPVSRLTPSSTLTQLLQS